LKVNDKYLPFYLKWVTEGYRFLDIPLSHTITNEQKSPFLEKNIEDQINSVKARQNSRLRIVLTVKKVNNIFSIFFVAA